jgi:hypothetical protein
LNSFEVPLHRYLEPAYRRCRIKIVWGFSINFDAIVLTLPKCLCTCNIVGDAQNVHTSKPLKTILQISTAGLPNIALLIHNMEVYNLNWFCLDSRRDGPDVAMELLPLPRGPRQACGVRTLLKCSPLCCR